MILLDQRHRFDLPHEVALLDCAYPAPLTATVVAGLPLPPDSLAVGSFAAPGGFIADEVSSRNHR